MFYYFSMLWKCKTSCHFVQKLLSELLNGMFTLESKILSDGLRRQGPKNFGINFHGSKKSKMQCKAYYYLVPTSLGRGLIRVNQTPCLEYSPELPSHTLRCRHSSMDSSVPSILLPRVWLPSTPSMLLSFIVTFVLYFFLHWEKNKNKQKTGRVRPI